MVRPERTRAWRRKNKAVKDTREKKIEQPKENYKREKLDKRKVYVVIQD